MNDLMIDFETLGKTPDCVVVSIGAVFFDEETGLLGDTFYMIFEMDSQLEKGRKIDPDTLKWWFSQSGAAKKIFHEKAKPTLEVLTTFVKWVEAHGTVSKIKPWGNGSSFDISIFEDLLRDYKVKIPWLYYNTFDLRTFKRYVANNEKVDKSIGVDHNALDDAMNQARYVIKHYKFFKEMIEAFRQLAAQNKEQK